VEYLQFRPDTGDQRFVLQCCKRLISVHQRKPEGIGKSLLIENVREWTLNRRL
jgi:hypothetical protein